MAFCILIIFCCVRFFSKGHTITYQVGENKIEVKEIYTRKIKNEIDNYYLEMEVNGHPFAFQFYHDFSKKRKVVEDIITYQGDYDCVLPIIEGKAMTDLLCYQENRYYFYNTIAGKDSALDEFVDTIDVNLYDKDDWTDESTTVKNIEGISLYTHNVRDDYTVLITNLKGVYQITDDITNIDIFSKDIYERKLSAVVANYYVVADYEESGQFRTFYFVDMRTGKISEAKAPDYISFNSYVQGVVDGKLYVYDKDNEKQYQINPKKKKIEEVGNAKKKIDYYEGDKWKEITTTKANQELYFQYAKDDMFFDRFDEVYHLGGEESGYYYLLEKVKGGYQLYRTPSQNKKIITYITTVKEKEDIYVIDDSVYFIDGERLKYYQAETGFRTLLSYSELEFNNNLLFGIIKK